MFLKTKAAGMIFMVVFALFSVSLLQPVQAAEQKVCCEKTKSNDFCQYTEQSNCDDHYKNDAVTCDQTSYCKPVCCVDENTGTCFKEVPVASCLNKQNSTVISDAQCQSDVCKKGCCQIGNQCRLSTQESCFIEASKYPDLPKDNLFHADITDEFTCINACRQEEEGCCVSGESCSYTTRGTCTTSGEEGNGGDGFYHGVYCSDQRLSCGCQQHAKKGCVEGKEEVYWFDSCGNREEVAEDCDYTQGTLCGEVNGKVTCKSTSCQDTSDYANNKEHDPTIGGMKKNGESWCVYEGRVGPSYDLVGSRHYRHLCISGKELIEPCADFRQELCFQSFLDNAQFSSAACVQNQGTSCVLECHSGDMVEDKQCCKEKSTCLWLNSTRDAGTCIPLVPLGLAFWPDAQGNVPKGDAKEVCDTGDTKCTSLWVKKLSGWECAANCDCEKDSWVQGANTFCRSLGDCGAYYNTEGKLTTEGQDASGKKTGNFREDQLESFDFLHQDGTLLLFNMTGSYHIFAEGRPDLNFLEKVFANPLYGGLIGATAAIASLIFVTTTTTTVLVSGAGVVTGAVTTTASLTSTLTGLLGPLGAALGPTGVGILFVAVVALLTYAVFSLLGVGETKQYVHKFNCEPWVAPEGGDQCEKCNQEGFTCSEYKCKSLGSMCQLVNEGTKQEKCVSVNPNDANAPVITPWSEALPQGYTLQTTPTGYYVLEHVKPLESFTFGIQLNEPSQCRFDEMHTGSYEEMKNIFGSELYETQKNMTVFVRGGKDFTYYLRCKDANGNKNIQEYTVQFTSAQEPDITPAVIEETSIANHGYVAYGTNGTLLTVYLNEPAQCKWSKVDNSYTEMDHSFSCADAEGQDTFFDLFPCTGGLDTINDDHDNVFYFRCKDDAGNENADSYVFHLQGTRPLEIASVEPQGEVYSANVDMKVTTKNGAQQGHAICSFGEEEATTEFFMTNGTTHQQQFINLSLGSYDFNIACYDVAGNTATSSISFDVLVDTEGPKISYIFSDQTTLHVFTNEASSCTYSTTDQNFLFSDGTTMSGELEKEHTAPLGASVYYIQCVDKEGNRMHTVTVYA